MKRYLLLVLLVATSVAAQTDKTPDKKTRTEPAAAAKKNVKTEAAKAQKAAPAKTKSAEAGTVDAQAETKKQSGQTEVAQAKTEAGPEEEPQAQTDPKLTSVPGGKALGMSILGNQETPTSLVIVPWKSSEVGRATGISPMLDDSRQPVDKEVFMRELRYYEIRSEKKQ
jgi:hypothetical protein